MLTEARQVELLKFAEVLAEAEQYVTVCWFSYVLLILTEIRADSE
jgi:hypothetical protein